MPASHVSNFSSERHLPQTFYREDDIGILPECAAVKIRAYVRNYEVTKVHITWNNPIIQRPHGERRVHTSMNTRCGNNRYRGLIKRWWSDPFTGTYRWHHFRAIAQMIRLNWVKIAQPNHQKIVGRLVLTEKRGLLTGERLFGM